MDNYYPIEFTEDSFSITNGGTAPCPCCVTIIPKVDIVTMVIKGLSDSQIKVTDIKANQTLVIDGENRTVTLDDAECFDKYDGWEFPKLQPGVNNIFITSGSLCQVAIEYNERYI